MNKKEMGCPHIENAIYNWYIGGDDADPYPIINAISAMIKDDMEILMPVEELDSAGELEDYIPNNTELLRISVQLIDDEHEPDKYWLPVFTDIDNSYCSENDTLVPFPLGIVLDNALKWPGCKGVVINPWGNDLHMEPDFIRSVLNHRARSHMTVTLSGTHILRTDAHVTMTTGENGGTAVASDSDKTGIFCEISAEVPEFTGKDSDGRLLAACFKNCLDEALAHDCRSISFPQVPGFPPEKAIQIASITTVNWFISHEDFIMDVYFSCSDRSYYDSFNEYFGSDSRVPQDMMDFEMAFDAYNTGALEEAFFLYSAAAVKGNIPAISSLGDCYYFGRGTQVDKAKAIECWKMAAESENVKALIRLSDMYLCGELEQDSKKAFDLLTRAYRIARADKDMNSYPDICLRLARNYRNVLDRKKYRFLIDEAIKYFKLRISEGVAFTEEPLREAEEMKLHS